ncbi:ABC transporter ATP-binding protein [Nocardioides dongxiaopingii]|uniref:oligopeptide/dipeptide ABC transporter ATP-binding protein n=1 Tax=Nocardioides sp. S-1144 TaxID=2582905 RepID=UPI00110D2CA9|nr:ABC transporter ATP-binding protein [Nocardioides sp. S-1144]QCW49369.1 ABC transporter ATP-binding protein [Nocardioides sp. S-1144]
MTTTQERAVALEEGRATVAPLLEVSGLSVSYAPPRKGVGLGTGAALTEASLQVRPGEIVGIVGETGSGKTTLARATVGLVRPAAGRIEFAGQDMGSLRGRALRDFRRSGQVQLVFQDPLRSLDPDLTVAELVREPLDVAGTLPRTGPGGRQERVAESLRLVGLDPETMLGRRPRELSGGQRQRISLARAISTRPKLLFCDEPVSALDVSNRNLVLSLLDRLRNELGLAVVIIAHDLSSLAGIADRVAVFYRSRVVEQGPIQAVLERPAHPYTGLLTASAPSVTQVDRLRPDQLRPEPGAREWPAHGVCVFAARCRFAHDACVEQPAPLRLAGDREAACHVAGAWRAQLGTQVGTDDRPHTEES